ncbi:MAG: hypothetical protein JRF72_09345 [Deltaproteobacteria bacterium]|jgi:hypothetical protein|nr:hypothetical protein [Deltaproteobacteria bacterium]
MKAYPRNLSLKDKRNYTDHDPGNDKVGGIRDKIREHHQNDTANQEYIIGGFFSVQKITEPDNTEKNNRHNPINGRMTHGGIYALLDSDRISEII